MTQRLCIFGEVLFDHFPDGRRVLGGAPFNVAWHLQALARSPDFISRVGDDAEGEAVRRAMSEWGLSSEHLQTDQQYPTGRVEVVFVDAEPAYDIVRPVAFDAIEADSQHAGCKLLYHGTLALRDERSHLTLKQLKASTPATVFIDVNLRAPWYELAQVRQMLHTANWAKLNNHELQLLHPAAKAGTAQAADFVQHYGLDGLVLTHGAAGAELFTAAGEQFAVQPEKTIEVVDTVGAGDAFAAIIILGLLHHWPFDISLQRAQQFASSVVGNRGATVSDRDFYQSFIKQWQLVV